MADYAVIGTKLVRSLGGFARRYLASCDPLQRRKIRGAARRLVPDKAWTEETATATEIASLALLRVLWLQRQTRRAARHHEDEATAMLARSAIDAALSGLYCVYVPDAEKIFDGETARRAKKLLGPVADGLGQDLLDGVFEDLGDGKLPVVTEMVKQIQAHGGGPGIGLLHRDFYEVVSTFYLHGGPLGLLRHVEVGTGKTRERPYSLWSRRSAVHTADAMVGMLAAAIVGAERPDAVPFVSYAKTHFAVTWTPLFFTARGLLATRLKLRHLPGAITFTRQLRAKVVAGGAINEADADEMLRRVSLLLGDDTDNPISAKIRANVRTKLLTVVAAPQTGEDDSKRVNPD